MVGENRMVVEIVASRIGCGRGEEIKIKVAEMRMLREYAMLLWSDTVAV